MLSGVRLYRIVDNDLSSVGPELHPAVAGLVNAAAHNLAKEGKPLASPSHKLPTFVPPRRG